MNNHPVQPQAPISPAYPWRLFFFLLLGSIVGALALLPYLSVVLAPILASHPLPLPLPLVVLAQSATNFSIAIALGLLLARKVGLGAPILEGWLYGRGFRLPPRLLLVSVATGLVVGLITLFVIRTPLGAVLTALPVVSEANMPLWKRFLACFYGGLDEELLTRLFLLSLILWLLGFLGRKRPASGNVTLFWIANLVAAVVFGAGHLPLALQLAPLSLQLVLLVVSLNTLCALPFGYLFWTRGLEAAIIAHFSADLILHVAGPMW